MVLPCRTVGHSLKMKMLCNQNLYICIKIYENYALVPSNFILIVIVIVYLCYNHCMIENLGTRVKANQARGLVLMSPVYKL